MLPPRSSTVHPNPTAGHPLNVIRVFVVGAPVRGSGSCSCRVVSTLNSPHTPTLPSVRASAAAATVTEGLSFNLTYCNIGHSSAEKGTPRPGQEGGCDWCVRVHWYTTRKQPGRGETGAPWAAPTAAPVQRARRASTAGLTCSTRLTPFSSSSSCAKRATVLSTRSTSGASAAMRASAKGQATIARHVIQRDLNPRLLASYDVASYGIL